MKTTTNATMTLTGFVNATGELPPGYVPFTGTELVEQDPLTGFWRVSATGAEWSDAAAWALSTPPETNELSLDPSKF